MVHDRGKKMRYYKYCMQYEALSITSLNSMRYIKGSGLWFVVRLQKRSHSIRRRKRFVVGEAMINWRRYPTLITPKKSMAVWLRAVFYICLPCIWILPNLGVHVHNSTDPDCLIWIWRETMNRFLLTWYGLYSRTCFCSHCRIVSLKVKIRVIWLVNYVSFDYQTKYNCITSFLSATFSVYILCYK